MASETKYRIALTILLLALLGICARNLYAQQAEGAMGVFPLPDVVAMSGQERPPPPPLKLDVVPRFVLPNPFKATTFRIRWRIEPHADNRKYRLESECNDGEMRSSEQALEGENEKATREVFQDMRGGPCLFTVILTRIVKGKEKLIVVTQEVKAPESDGGSHEW